MGVARTVVLLLVVVIILIFTLYNYTTTTNIFLFGKTYTISTALLSLFAFIFGIISVVVFAIVEEIGLRAKIRKLKKENRNLKKELDALRNLPLGKEEE